MKLSNDEMDISLSELSNVKGIGKKTIQRIREYKLADEGYISEYDKNLHLDRNSVNQGDCLELMNGIPDKSIDMILADLPYGTTACSWDSIIDLDKLWLQYERIIKDNGAIVLTASQPFTTKLINSNISWYKYSWIWNKILSTGFAVAKYKPMKQHESILVFGKGKVKYNPQMIKRDKPRVYNRTHKKYNGSENLQSHDGKNRTLTHYYPKTIIKYSNANHKNKKHPTQKPVKLFEYLIKTYTNKGDLVLDNVAGSGTTGVACQNLDRDYILIEKEQKYIDVINERLKAGDE